MDRKEVFFDRLLPDQVEMNWDRLRGILAEALPEYTSTHPIALVNFLKSALREITTVWCLQDEDELKVVVSTYIHVDPVVMSRHLFIYTLTAVSDGIDLPMIEQMISSLKKYAKSRGCSDIRAYTLSDPLAKTVVNKLGGNSDWMLITIPLGE